MQTPDTELFTADFLAVAPEMTGTIETLRGLLVKLMSGGLGTDDVPAIDDAIARSGHASPRKRRRHDGGGRGL